MSDNYYNSHVNEIAQQYLSLSFDDVHQSWAADLADILSKSNSTILDVGAGSGRDAAHMARLAASINNPKNTCRIYAIEPAIELFKVGQALTRDDNVYWLQDSLPALDKTFRLEVSFDLILLSAVWMHIPPGQRARSIRKLANLLKPGGKIVISMKFGMTAEQQQQRQMYAVSVEEVERYATQVGLISRVILQNNDDKLGRDGIYWQTIVLQMPDDGTGAFPFIRHVAVNDGKSATHKLALLRVLLRIADGHPGAVLRTDSCPSGDRVVLPVGLVALYWCHQYKNLIDTHKFFQTPKEQPNMGFMKADGWHKLTHRSAADYRVGNVFTGADAKALYRVISASVDNIKKMPCSHITLPNSSKAVFEVCRKTVRAKEHIFLDLHTLEQWGEFSLPESTWLSLNRYACWIEPVIVSEWVKTMSSYSGNAQFAPHQLHQGLHWLEPKRTTLEVRNRFEDLKRLHHMQCVWSATGLKDKYDIDHNLPFSRWANNDLWNLLPTHSKVNNEKRDRLPSQATLLNARTRMQNWWKMAWLDPALPHHKQRFFAEANIALPGLSCQNDSIEDVFEALLLQRARLKEMQQLVEW